MKCGTWKCGQLMLIATVVVTLAACGGGDSGSSDAPPSIPSATENQINPMPRDQLRQGGTLTWALNNIPPNYNYYQLDGTELVNFWVIAALMPTTYTTDASGTPHWNRDLLASEPTVVTTPRQTVTYQINPSAAWYDGTPITWEDFHWQWKASNGTDKRYLLSNSNGYENIESVERGRDDRQVIVTFRTTFADWTSIFNQIYPVSTNKDPQIFNEGWKNAPLTSAGPFKFASINQTTQTIILVRNEKWWGEPALLDSIVYRVIAPDAQIDAAANGEIDAMDIGPDANKYKRAKTFSGLDVRTAGGPNYRHLTFNGTSANLKDRSVRQAIAMGIDRNMIARAMLTPLGVSATPLDNHIYMSNQAGYRNNSGAVGQYNPAKAGEMLDAAGWKMDGDVRKKDGKPLEVVVVIPAAVATARQESEIVQNSLANIGVKAEIRTVPGPDFFDKYVSPGQFDIVIFSWIGTAYPLSNTKSLYAKPTQRPDGTLNVLQNYARIGSDQIDSLFDAANAELDRDKAIDLGNRIDSLIWDEVHSLATYQRPELILTKKTLANFGAFGFAIPWVYQDIGWMK